MKKITFLLLFLISFQGFSQEKKAKIEFKQTEIDYGTINKNADGTRVFEFTNTGDAPLIINRVKSSCGCTIPSKPTQPIMPGKSDKIVVKYNTHRAGPFRKTVTIYSNAVNNVVILKIKGKVVDPNAVNLQRQSKSPVVK
ncbi:MAG TPA: DUF1573 domain-containing protein [Flavobacteriales bacterium]|jgi:hypothetical protein|nr:DUF1573 domain-containing protein [Flavobacteriales bacterium]